MEHVRAQELIAATSTVKVQRENVGVPVAQAKPVVPTQTMMYEHSLTHYPYQSWRETCDAQGAARCSCGAGT